MRLQIQTSGADMGLHALKLGNTVALPAAAEVYRENASVSMHDGIRLPTDICCNDISASPMSIARS